ncbi:MAG: hypothetical protein N838_26080 [Thiohalocapsa sp. PB-PSB1]|nr:MAG: hypothetical protein N838_26080 [Thiohalocapsa sp. PB-PSB1]
MAWVSPADSFGTAIGVGIELTNSDSDSDPDPDCTPADVWIALYRLFMNRYLGRPGT